MRSATLGEVARIVSGATPRSHVEEYWGGEVQWATPADLSKLTGPYVSATPRTLTSAGLASCAATELPAGSVLLSSRAPIGHVAINTVPMATNQGFKSLVPGQGLDAKYLYYWLRAHTSYLQSLGNGATFKELSKRTVESIEIPLPPLDEQRRIAAILDKADEIRTKRREALAHLDQLPRSVFTAMFSKVDWERQEIAAVGVVTTGRTPPTNRPALFGGAIPFVTPGDLGSGRTSARTVTPEGAVASRTVRAGATFVCCIGATIGKVGQARERSAFNQQLNAVEWGDTVNDSYGAEAMRQMRAVIRASGASTTLPLLSKGQFQRLEVPVPPLDLQREFAAKVAAIETQRAAVERALAADDELFASLQSSAFRGEL